MDPDVILVGEMRDLETIRAALEAAETGHLVFGTLHTSGAASTIVTAAVLPASTVARRLPVAAAYKSSSKSPSIRGTIDWVSGSPNRQLNSRTRGPASVIITPA